MDDTATLRTHCYTKDALDLVCAAMRYEQERSFFTSYPLVHFGGGVQLARPFPNLDDFDVWSVVCRQSSVCKLAKEAVGKNLEDYCFDYSAAIEPDGEAAFHFKLLGKAKQPRAGTLINIIMRWYREKLRVSGEAKAKLTEAAELVCRAIVGKLTAADRESLLYSQYVGKPLDPFKQQVLAAKKLRIEELSAGACRRMYGFFSHRTPEQVELAATAYNEYFSCIG